MRARTVAALAVLMLGATARQGDEKATPPPPTTEAGLTTPGSTLQVGETARVPVRDSVIDLTITEIEEGSPDEALALGYSDAFDKTDRFYYVRYTLQLVSGDGIGIEPLDFLSGWSGNAALGELVVPGSYPPCERRPLPVDPPIGSSVDGCRTYVAGSQDPPPATVRFDDAVA